MSTSFAGIDVGSEKLDVVLLSSKQKAEHRVFENTERGCKALCEWLREYPGTRCVMEATGFYFLPSACALHASDIPVMVLNPLVAKDFRSALGRRAKTDKVDSLVLAEYARRMEFQPWSPCEHQAMGLRALLRRREQLAKQLVQERNRRHAFSFVPELPELLVQELNASIESLELKVANYENAANSWAKEHKHLWARVKLAQTVPGLGRLTALTLISETFELPKDMSSREWVAYAGLDPRPYLSGKSVNKGASISKRGNARIRRALFMPALAARTHNPAFKAFYRKLIHAGKAPMQARIAVMRKLLVAAWATQHHRSDFNPHLLFPRIQYEIT